MRALVAMVVAACLVVVDPAIVRSMADRGIAVHYKPLQVEDLRAFIGRSAERRSADDRAEFRERMSA